MRYQHKDHSWEWGGSGLGVATRSFAIATVPVRDSALWEGDWKVTGGDLQSVVLGLPTTHWSAFNKKSSRRRMAPTTPTCCVSPSPVPSCPAACGRFSRTWGVQPSRTWSCHAATATRRCVDSLDPGAPQHRSHGLDRLSPLAAAFERGAAGLQRLRDAELARATILRVANRQPPAGGFRQCADRAAVPGQRATVTWSHHRRSVASSGRPAPWSRIVPTRRLKVPPAST